MEKARKIIRSILSESIKRNLLKYVIKENNAKYLLSPEDRKEYLAWKRKNVSFRGLSGESEENGGGARFGTGLYTAALSNKKMSKEYGTVYYVINAIPKNPIVFNDTNQAEIWIGNTLIPMYTGKGKYPDTRKFYEITTLRDAIMKLGYDGLVIKGREMVNYDPPHDVSYFRDESQVISYWKTTVKKDLS